MSGRTINAKEALSGTLMLLLGVGAAVQSLQYRLGTLSRMGPGFFPLCLGVGLAVIGAIILTASLRVGPRAGLATDQDVGSLRFRPEWRGWACILAGLAAFAVLGETLGIMPATFATVFIAALGDRENSWRAALLIAAGMTAIAFVVFWWLLQVQLPLLRWG